MFQACPTRCAGSLFPGVLESVMSFGPEDDPEAAGMSAAAGDRIWRAALALYRSGIHPAVQVCVRRNGAVIVNRAIGHARGNGPRDTRDTEKVPATPRTPFVIYSASKALTAFVVHMLHDRGELDISEPVASYIPEYAANGKGEITIGQVLAHRAGVPTLPRAAFDLDRALDRDFMLETLCAAKPMFQPGKYLAYHAVSGGFILGEVVHRVTGMDIRAVLANEILNPLSFRWTNYGVAPNDLDAPALNYVTGPPTAPPLSQLLTRALGVRFDELVALSNDPRFLTGVVPAANVVTSAEELSRFFEIFRRGGELDGVRVMSAAGVRRALTEQSRLEIDLSLGFPTRFSYGLMLGAQVVSLYGRDTQHAFGHLGFTNMLAWADPERGLSCAVMTNGKPVLYPELPRFYALIQMITSAAPKLAGSEMRVWDPLAGRPA